MRESTQHSVSYAFDLLPEGPYTCEDPVYASCNSGGYRERVRIEVPAGEVAESKGGERLLYLPGVTLGSECGLALHQGWAKVLPAGDAVAPRSDR